MLSSLGTLYFLVFLIVMQWSSLILAQDRESSNNELVLEDFQCSPDVVTALPSTETTTFTDTLPPECYSPRGYNNCDWYRNCLEVRYPCQYSPDSYAIEYAEKFCKLYSYHYDNFTPSGREWIDGVRICLQVYLVPFMRPWMNKTCASIKQEAFNSHSNCYLKPAPGASGICLLSLEDILRAFWLVIFEGGALYSAPVETGSQMLSVIQGCLLQWQLSNY